MESGPSDILNLVLNVLKTTKNYLKIACQPNLSGMDCFMARHSDKLETRKSLL